MHVSSSMPTKGRVCRRTPVTQLASSLARNTAALAMSSGIPRPLKGWMEMMWSRLSSSARERSTGPVTTSAKVSTALPYARSIMRLTTRKDSIDVNSVGGTVHCNSPCQCGDGSLGGADTGCVLRTDAAEHRTYVYYRAPITRLLESVSNFSESMLETSGSDLIGFLHTHLFRGILTAEEDAFRIDLLSGVKNVLVGSPYRQRCSSFLRNPSIVDKSTTVRSAEVAAYSASKTNAHV